MGMNHPRAFLLAIPGIVICGISCQDSDPGPGSLRDPSETRWHSPESPHEVWTFTGPPALEIGTTSGPVEEQFNVVRGIRLDSDGRVWVVDGGSAEIRVFDMDGQFLYSTAGRGEGPGEFQAPNLLGTIPGDTVLVWDYRLYRLNLFSEEAEFLATETVATDGSLPPRPLAVLPGPSFLTQQGRMVQADSIVPGQVLTDTVRLQRTSRDFTESGPLVEAGITRWIWTGTNQYLVPFTTGPRFTVVGGGVVMIPDNDDQFVVVDLNGRVIRRFGVQWPPRPVNARAREGFRAFVEAQPLPEAYREDWIAQAEHDAVPDHLPHYDLLTGNENREVWARRYAVIQSEDPVWDVFSLEGDWVAEARFPQGFLLYGADLDWVYGVSRDSLDVEYVRFYRRSR